MLAKFLNYLNCLIPLLEMGSKYFLNLLYLIILFLTYIIFCILYYIISLQLKSFNCKVLFGNLHCITII